MRRIPVVTEEQWNEINEWNRNITQEFLEQGHLSLQTLNQYRSTLKIFFRWVKEYCNNKPLYELKPRDALKYQNYLINRGLSSSAIKLKRSAVSSLCGYLELYYLDEFPMFRNIYSKQIPSPPKTVVHEKKPLNQEEYKLLIDTLEENEKWQMLAYVKFTYASGCRRSEVRQLLKEIITYEKIKNKNYYTSNFVRCKGRGREGNVRRLQFDDEALDAIKKWLEVRGEDDCPYVFATKKQNGYEQISVYTFNYWCANYFSDIVGRRVHPHQFREKRATDIVVNEGKDIKTAQKLLGHQSSTTTEIYVIRETDDDLDDAF